MRRWKLVTGKMNNNNQKIKVAKHSSESIDVVAKVESEKEEALLLESDEDDGSFQIESRKGNPSIDPIYLHLFQKVNEVHKKNIKFAEEAKADDLDPPCFDELKSRFLQVSQDFKEYLEMAFHVSPNNFEDVIAFEPSTTILP